MSQNTDNFVANLIAGIFEEPRQPAVESGDGIVMVNNMPSPEVLAMLDKFKLNWKVEKQPLKLPSGALTPFHGIVRTDNETTFATCKDGYIPYQNSELAELVMRIGEKTGYSMDNGGMFNGGGKVYIQLYTNDDVKGIGRNNDLIKKYVTAVNSHDGSSSLRWGHTNVTISCRNTFAAAARDMKSSARHTQSIHQQVEKALREIEGVKKIETSIFDQYFKLAETPVKKNDIVKIVKAVTEVDILLTKDEIENNYSSYQRNRMSEFMESIQSEMAQKGETLWGLFSGATHYTTHKMPVPKRDNARLESKYVGGAYKTDNEVFSLLAVK